MPVRKLYTRVFKSKRGSGRPLPHLGDRQTLSRLSAAHRRSLRPQPNEVSSTRQQSSQFISHFASLDVSAAKLNRRTVGAATADPRVEKQPRPLQRRKYKPVNYWTAETTKESRRDDGYMEPSDTKPRRVLVAGREFQFRRFGRRYSGAQNTDDRAQSSLKSMLREQVLTRPGAAPRTAASSRAEISTQQQPPHQDRPASQGSVTRDMIASGKVTRISLRAALREAIRDFISGKK